MPDPHRSARGVGAGQTMLAILAGIGFLVRILPYRNFLGENGGYLLYGPDSYDHVRRIMLGLASFPRVPLFDAYYGYPVGTGQIWSPLFDYLISLLVLAGGGGEAAVYAVGFWLPPLLAALTVWVAGRTAQKMAGRGAGLAAALVIALLPGHIIYSLVSELDHHVAEPLVCMGIMLSLMKWLSGQRRAKPASGLPGWTRPAAWLLFALLIWRGAIIFWGIALGAIVLELVLERENAERVSAVSRFGVGMFLTAAGVLAVFCFANLMGATNGLNARTTSWFHVGFLTAGAAVVALVAKLVRSSSRRLSAPLLACTLALGLAVLIVPFSRQFVLEFGRGLGIIFARDAWLDSISELRPMLYPSGRFAPWHALETLSVLYWLVPFVAVFHLRNRMTGHDRRFSSTLFIVSALLLWLLPLFRERYVHLAALAVAFSAAMTVGSLFDLLMQRWRRPLCIAACFATMLVMLLPVWPFLRTLSAQGLSEYERQDLMQTLSWLREHTPPTTGYDTPVRPPEYGVLSPWWLGAYITTVARRPTVATNFGWETHGLHESSSFLSTADRGSAERIARNNRVRYLLLSHGVDLERLHLMASQRRRHDMGPQQLDPMGSVYVQLYYHDGSGYAVAGAPVRAMGTYRLLYQSPNGFPVPERGLIRFYKIFERVPGSRWQVTGLPGLQVDLTLTLVGRDAGTVVYRDRLFIDRSGQAEVTVPYPTGAASGTFMPTGPYLVSIGGTDCRVTVTDKDVQEGILKKLPQACDR